VAQEKVGKHLGQIMTFVIGGCELLQMTQYACYIHLVLRQHIGNDWPEILFNQL
jgi:hypothetical protein